MTDIFLMDAIRSGTSTDWGLDSSSEASKTPLANGPVPARLLAERAEGREDLSRMMDPPNIKQTPASPSPGISETHRVDDPDAPRLRLACATLAFLASHLVSSGFARVAIFCFCTVFGPAS